MPDAITLTHTLDEVNLILSALSDRPFKEVVGLVFKIKSLAEEQMKTTESVQDVEPA